ncbi:hypothetical protein Pan97_15640 [Bremerella volcania]|uniref:Uncharacterized protein n=1 Tax=Bremerella volcania TaxID=2527984 RepID=A0A518C5Q1_9BACT|nr:hypothetical protein [Bremerella volcania]QDU74555.1 hypothetical protein Pan97_15640 [Bremerella volcania]
MQLSLHYTRYGKDWTLWATKGEGTFFDEHKSTEPDRPHEFFDIREVPLRFHEDQISPSSAGFEKNTAEDKAEYHITKQQQKEARERGDDYVYLPRGKRHSKLVGRVCIHRDRYEERGAYSISTSRANPCVGCFS